ncbi:MAG: sulfite exporter TauE/SafE family protein [Thermoplasmata archaeon]|nr:MAG: sulfite exporter TauE/SafE family protein [Thermoplasmata archaeon]
MDWSVVATSLILGFGASLSCLGLCMPILIPYIVGKDKTFREGFITASLFSVGRFLIYFGMGVVVFMVGSALTEDAPRDFLKVAVAILGTVVIVYGVIMVFRVPRPKWCPSKITNNIDPFFSLILGLLIGSFFCPLLWAALIAAALTRDFLTMVLSVAFFWVGSSVAIFITGTVFGEVGGRSKKRIGKDKIRDMMGMILIMVGAIYIANGLIV